MKTISINISLFKDGDYMLLLSTRINGTNVRLQEDCTVLFALQNNIETFKNLYEYIKTLTISTDRKYETNINVSYDNNNQMKSQ